jgi:hypothetical protein
MAEGEDREEDDDREEKRSDESGDTSASEESEESEEDKGPAFHPHARAATEGTGDEESDGDDEDDELPDDEPPPGAESEKSREQERRQKDTPDEEETREPQRTEDRDRDEDEDEEKGPPPPFRAFMLFVATVVFLFVGFMFFSALIAPTYIVALILAALWFVAAYFLLGRFTRNRRHLRFPIRIGFGLFVTAVLLWIIISTLSGTTVNEQLVTGQKLSEGKPTARIPEKPQSQAPAQNILVATGEFESSGAGSASGQASFVRLPSGQTKLTLKGLDVTSGPTLHVFLATHDGKSVADSKDLGTLKGNKGDQQYDVPQNVDPKRYKSVVIWSKFLGVPFGRAETKAQ